MDDCAPGRAPRRWRVFDLDSYLARRALVMVKLQGAFTQSWSSQLVTGITRRSALLIAAGLGAGASTSGCSGATNMEVMDFERSRISWTVKSGDINGIWRIIATACRQDSA